MAFASTSISLSLHPPTHCVLPSDIMATLAEPSSHHQDTDRTFAMHKYLLLHHEQDSLRRRLSSSSTDLSRSSSLDTAGTSPPSGSSPHPVEATSGVLLDRVSSHDSVGDLPVVLEEVDEDSWRQLLNVNHQIKSTLTDLLNCESVKHDAKFRLWVSTRLMDAEMELKKQRKLSVESGGGGGLWRREDF